jgi:hypothetical protein
MMAVIPKENKKKRLPLPNLGEGKDNRGGLQPYYFKDRAMSDNKKHIHHYLL